MQEPRKVRQIPVVGDFSKQENLHKSKIFHQIWSVEILKMENKSKNLKFKLL